MKESVVYVLCIAETGHFYVGSTENFEKRYKRHIKELNYGNHHNSIFQELWGLGKELLITTMKMPDRESAYKCERDLLREFSSGPRSHLLMNIGLDSRAGDNLTRHPEKESIVGKRTQSQKVMYSNMSVNERKKKYGLSGEQNPMYGRKHTAEARKIMSEVNIGRIPPNKGKPMREDQRQEMIARQKLRTGELNSFYGKKHSEETRKILSERNKLNPNSARKVEINGKQYRTILEASLLTGMKYADIGYRLRNDLYPNFSYI